MEPMRMKPYFRCGESTPWGGCKLRDALLKNAPDDRTGESLEVSALAGMESEILSGECAGMTLGAALASRAEEILGGARETFPLLLKILDARDSLSVQVHPGDEYARAHEGMLGKTEAWLVLQADEGAQIAYGVKDTGESLEKIAAGGDWARALNFIPVQPGDVYYIPHGMVHALGGGVMVYEIQQSSNVTYRLWDWNRLGKNGKPRELHTQKALDVIRPGLKMGKIAGATALCEGGSRTYYVCDDNFELSRLNVAGHMPLEGGRMRFVTPMGECRLAWPGGEMRLGFMETALVPASARGVCVHGRLPVLSSALPNRAALREELGYRAENVAGLETTI